jgi:cell wall-associated NlpC family hydrolase
MWLGSATLAGLLLASSLTASASSQTATATTITRSPMKPVLVASSIVPSGTYTEAVRKQMQWISRPVIAKVKVETDSTLENSVPTPSDSVTVAAQKPQPAKQATAQPAKKATAKPAKSNPKSVQVAASPQQQVSRSDSSALVNNARSLVGVPYVFGGTSRSGFDCSGYTQYVFKGSGISLPRTAAEQFNVGSSVKQAQLQSGDLVFFTTYASGASHVGIYIGGGSFVHASNSGVRTSSLSDSYYAPRYLGARRP